MSQKFNATIAHKRGISLVKLSGIVDEDNRLAELVDQLGSGTVVIDLAEVDRINSCGVRDWVGWLGRVEAKPARVVLVECSPSIVAQINLVSNFTGGGAVKSFYAPYFCAECDQEKVLLVDVADLGPPPIEPPTCRCDECDLVMDFDDMPDSYFAFLGNHKRLTDGDQLDGALREFAASELGERSKIRSRGSSSNVGAGGTPAPPSVPSLQSIARVATAAPARLETPSPVDLGPRGS
ncbi:MAG: STAS domain-containing protein, partial [Kofleriaceae bacterium]